jgi:glycosyltransferase involved in cell wall biosynthesis
VQKENLVATGKRLLILTRDRTSASFRQRVDICVDVLAARGIGVEVVELAAAALLRRRQWRMARQYDAIFLQRKTLTAWDAWALGKPRRLIYDFDDAVMFQARAPEAPHTGRLRRFERTAQLADLVIAGSPILAEHAARAGARSVAVIPTGLNAGAFPPRHDYALAGGAVRLVWIGSRSTLKQIEPFRVMFDALARAMPGFTLRVIADGALSGTSMYAEHVPWSLAEEGRRLAECDVGIAPLPDTPFTRGKCAYKIVQYMAAGLPVIASPVGVQTDYVQPAVNGFWARTPDEWIAAVRQLAEDAALRERLGRAGRARVEAEFDTGALATKICDLVEKVMA